ncbi:2OG-Fe(II) oxygenase [Pseudomonas fluorescens]|uniref:2OG-Fe(II) oxygenase n=1 Tax=Pseudomonas fluorescens TaxID=294 RepID=A0A944DHW9_PSEFL|nr:2OG-Fe(II) oxygenase [Pseudomonas fluorescens]MBT2295638.1 2OG-Fe(II) oxygenase [Pseudomonas fluorescens]MBT2310462.1 2OG-Fe(II) oxygenase [Pseudomonas fluorescens]MBT2313970.1 2OG-Fe(II) oxygenase [Pseudomonas fluorescens]MBT2318686.1 2OG-Fe(II) oxygenase [Pseudomonas fluorescens]MBT2329536.1 2OG-Fe(II) oxygenase [Pseudomonas fluorescens]
MSATALCLSLAQQISTHDWSALEQNLDQDGSAIIRNLVTARQCKMLSGRYAEGDLFRSKVIMARHGFGRGEYQYFRYPLPDVVQQLRQSLYSRLVPLANRWNECMGLEVRYPDQHADFIQRCHAAGQRRPTPLLLQYGPLDYNCLHQDLYGEQVFPLQVAILLSEPGRDFSGGEFVLTEQRPRMQSRPQVIDLKQGDALVFAVHQRPVKGVRGYYRVNMRHGVSRVHSGSRHTLGIIFHDAQ